MLLVGVARDTRGSFHPHRDVRLPLHHLGQRHDVGGYGVGVDGDFIRSQRAGRSAEQFRLDQQPLGEGSRGSAVLPRDHDVLGAGPETESGEIAEVLGVHRPGHADRITLAGQQQRALGVAIETGDDVTQPLHRMQGAHAMEEEAPAHRTLNR